VLCDDEQGRRSAAAEAEKYRALAASALPAADLCLIAAAPDCDRLAAAFPAARFMTVPNGFPAAAPIRPARVARNEIRLLFVGTLGYLPNADAAMVLVRDLLPALRQQAPVPVRVDIVGAGASDALIAVARDPAVILHGFVPDLAPFYGAVDIAALPLRVAGGTSIKLLEAFAHRCPVVATPTATRGIEVVSGEHLLLADDRDGFVAAILRLWADTALSARCVDRAAMLLSERYGAESVARTLAAAYATLEIGGPRGGTRLATRQV